MHINRGSYGNPPPPPQSTAPFTMPPSNSMSMSSIGLGGQPHQQYPSINSIPGMHSMSHMSGIQGISGLQGMHAMQPFSTIPSISAMQSLMHPPAGEPTTIPSVSNSHFSSTFGTSGPLSGAIEKRRKPKGKSERLLHNTLLNGEDPQSMMMATHQATQVISHGDPTGGFPASNSVVQADGIQFKLLEQLPDTKIQRLRTEKIKPIEWLTFADIKAYNRNQLRAYCSVYGIRRKKKAEMEKDMARYASLFHPNDPAYDVSKFSPTEYADGPIPRRKVPVTKEQKEKAAGDVKRLTSALQQRPHANSGLNAGHHYGASSAGHHHMLSSGAGAYHHTSSLVAAPRLHDIHGSAHAVSSGGGAGMGHHHGGATHDDGNEAVVAAELMNVPEIAPNHLLSISNQIVGEE